MNRSHDHSNKWNQVEPQVGLLVSARGEIWEVSIDESTTGRDRWYLQIESPMVYLYIEISSPSIIQNILNYLQLPESTLHEIQDGVELGTFQIDSVVSLIRDDEFKDRLFFIIPGDSGSILRLAVTGAEFQDLLKTLCKVEDLLNSPRP